jgi:hypothetical protein
MLGPIRIKPDIRIEPHRLGIVTAGKLAQDIVAHSIPAIPRQVGYIDIDPDPGTRSIERHLFLPYLHDLRGATYFYLLTDPKVSFACGSMVRSFSFMQKKVSSALPEPALSVVEWGDICHQIRDRLMHVSSGRFAGFAHVVVFVVQMPPRKPAAAWYVIYLVHEMLALRANIS